MTLALIGGPPNSGRTGIVLDRFEAAIDADPILVVPTSDDVDRFERELCGRAGGLLGGTVTTFPGLFGILAGAVGVGARAPLSRMQRVWIARQASRRAGLRILHRSAERDGFAPALEALISDLQAAGLDAAGFEAIVAEHDGGRYEREVASLFAAYEQLRDGLGRADEHGLAAAATATLRADPRRWRGRPVLLYGFDDLSREQIELIAALAAAAEVTVALAYEDRPALAARAELLGLLRDELGGTVEAELSPDRGHTPSETLYHLERNLFEPEPETCECDDSLHLLESAGERGEAELIGRRIARLIADGVDPDAIAIAARSPDRQAPLLARVLASLGIPVAAEARIPLATTATGSTLLRLLAIADGSGTASDVLAFLRGPARARPESVDWLERSVRRRRLLSCADALEEWGKRDGRTIWALGALAEAGGDPVRRAQALTRIAADIAERPHLRQGPLPSSGASVELRAAAEAGRALAEVAELGDLAPSAAETAELLGHVRVPLWRGPTEGRVRVLSPYRLRATRVSHLFVAGLIDGAFPAPGGAEPLLSEDRRRELGLAARRDPAAEERYLFYSCVSRPEHGLHLSYPASDESGAAVARSPFVDEVRALLDPPPTPDPADDPLEAQLAVRISVGDIAPAPESASSPRDLARALAALDPARAEARLAALEVPEEIRAEALATVARARAGVRAARAPGPLSEPAVLAALAARENYGASTLEEYDLCPYRWFVGRELDPQSIDPDPEPLETGSIVHAALERLYREAPAGARPQPETVERWLESGRERLRECALDREWDLDSSRARISLARLDAVLERFLHRDAAEGGPLQPDPDLLEAAFGDRDDDAHPPADVGTFKLHGKIDRIDVSADRKALIRDYKLSSNVTRGAKLVEEGKLQLPLYMLAVKGMGLEPIGGLYHPLGASKDDRPRGLMAREEKDALIPSGTAFNYSTDFMDEETFEQVVDGAAGRSREIVAAMRAGVVTRSPRKGKCPTWCAYAPVCRMERGAVDPDEEDEEDERP